jgi:hypothetical protein
MYDYDYRNKLDYYNYTNNNYNQPMYTKDENPNTLYDPYNGFIRGNMFPDIYNSYKNNKPYDITPKNDKESLLLYVDTLGFAAHDINLYLDIYPNDKDMIELFTQYKNEADQLAEEYQSKFGPLVVNNETTNKIPWSWDNNPWPWE